MRSFLRNRRFKNFAFKTDVLCSCLLLNSKTSIYIHDPAKGTNITIPNNKMALVSYSKITSSNISYTGFGIIVSRVRDELTGKLTEIQSVENISLSLEGNKLIASSESWFRIIVTVL